jgi:hypothetical protein
VLIDVVEKSTNAISKNTEVTEKSAEQMERSNDRMGSIVNDLHRTIIQLNQRRE